MQMSKVKKIICYGMSVGFGMAFTGIATVSISKLASILRVDNLERRR